MPENPNTQLAGQSRLDPNIAKAGDTVRVELMYPPYEADKSSSAYRFIQVGMCHVRAADGLRISYDFGRDGWKIEQASTFEWEADDEECDPDWQEVAFVQAWGREKAGDGE